jgi:hypothetical protein
MRKKKTMTDIDGYVSKDDLYRLISNIKHDISLSQEQVNKLCEAIAAMESKDLSKDEPIDTNPYAFIHSIRISNKQMLAEPYIMDMDFLMLKMADCMQQMRAWIITEAVQEAVLMVAPWEVGKEKYFSDKVDSLISEWKEKRL